MALKDEILQIEPELSGAVSSDAFDYQKDWAICKLIELHQKGDDYAVVFEYHEDIAIVNSSEDPTKIHFYQVKTRSKNLTIAELIKWEKGTEKTVNSILGKLYLFKTRFTNAEYVESLNIVSNEKFKVKLLDGISTNKDVICFSELNKQELDEIKESLIEELNLVSPPAFEACSFMLVSELTKKHHAELTRDKLSVLVSSEYPDALFRPGEVYRVIFDTVRKKNRPIKCATYSDLINLKSISRQEFAHMLAVVARPDAHKERGAHIEQILAAQSASYFNLQTFRMNWERLRIEKINGDPLFIEITRAVTKLLNQLGPSDMSGTHLECAELVLGKLKNAGVSIGLYDDDLLRTLILSVMQDAK